MFFSHGFKAWCMFLCDTLIIGTMNMTITKLYDFLLGKFGRDSAENLTNFIDLKIEKEMQSKWDLIATKADLAKSQTEIIKWMFVFWIGQMAVTFGFILLFLKK